MSSFPLYDLLVTKYNKLIKEDPSNKDISFEEIREMIDGVMTMEKEHIEHVFVLIRIHSLKNENIDAFDTPYKGEKMDPDSDNTNIKFDVRNMPPMLRRILLEYVRMIKDL